ncbi:MAG: bifunctional riboflavin kinase/FAD synthetase [Microbacterium sp.]|nr:MAG: bifunctional riboflavin kinase/FAD synthetase [Microbacterium sp.]
MIVIHDPAAAPAGLGPSVVAIGKFDGVHSGHRAVIDRARVAAAELGDARVVAVTFDRNPLSLLRPELCPEPLASVAQKLDLLAAEGVDATVLLQFDNELAALSPREFVEHVLVPIGVVRVMVGADFRFGSHGAGDPTALAALGDELGFRVDVIGDVQGAGRRVSSTWVRDLLAQGDVQDAGRLLGRPHALEGEVVHGLKRGRELGFPTANLSPDAEGLVPADGIYAGWLVDLGPMPVGARGGEHAGVSTRYPAAISVGTNPTFDDVAQRQVEAYVIDDDLDLYGHRVQLQFVARVRGMLAFDGIEPLIAQMRDDVAEVRRLLE